MGLCGCDLLHALLLLLLHAIDAASLLLPGLVAARLSLVLQSLLADLLGLGLVNVVHQHALVLELVTLTLEVQVAIEVLVDLGGLAVLAQQTAEDAHAADPNNLGGEASLAGTTALTSAGVTALGLGLIALVNASARVDGVGLADHIAVLDELANVLAWREKKQRQQKRVRTRTKEGGREYLLLL